MKIVNYGNLKRDEKVKRIKKNIAGQVQTQFKKSSVTEQKPDLERTTMDQIFSKSIRKDTEKETVTYITGGGT